MTSPLSSLFTGEITRVSHGLIEGWAIAKNLSKKHPYEKIWLHVLIDGQEVDRILCNLPRPEEASFYQLPNSHIGFSWEIPKKFFDGTERLVSLRFPDRSILPFPASLTHQGPSSKMPHTDWLFGGKEQTETRSYLEGLKDGRLKGWVVQRNGLHGRWKGQTMIDIHVDGRPLARLRADHQRADVAHSLKSDNFSTSEPDIACGFDYPLPASLRDGAYHDFHVTVLPKKIPLHGSPLREKYLDDSTASRLANINNMLDALQQQLTHIRRETLALMPSENQFSIDQYERWYRHYQKSLATRIARQRKEEPLTASPLLSIICPVFHPQEEHFQEAVESVRKQSYAHWNLLLVFDGKQDEATHHLAQKFQKADSRIQLLSLPKQGGIAAATNKGLENIQGDYVLFLDHDDMLDPYACEIMVRAALKTKADILYSDEDKISPGGHFHSPHLKPDFNYRYLLGCNYLCHLSMFRSSLLKKIGGLKTAYDGAQDHDLLLRAYEASPQGFLHVPEILYHWRQSPSSTALSADNKKYAKRNGAKAVRHHLARQAYKANVTPLSGMTLYKTSWTLPESPPSVSIIIPFRDQAELTGYCVEQLLKTQSYPNFSIILIDNWSVEPKTEILLKTLSKNEHISILRVEEEFNFSRLNNLAAEKSESDYLFFLNNDVEVKQKDFLSRMMGEMLNMPDAGAVGARLLYPSKRLQHGGIAVSPDAIAVHMHRGRDERDLGYMGRACLSQEVSAVTGAALLTKKTFFTEIGGFDEEHFPIAYNDVDFCLRLRKKNYRIYYCAEAQAIHHESFSRGSDELCHNERRLFQESQRLLDLWGKTSFFQRDPFYPQNFVLEGETFHQLRKPENF